ncbi:MAG: hypothetical protein VXW49_13415, partial [Pseudomonadota bacterium]|nr:hypothetical protein [Pseudomonadota bacterium]
MACIVFFVPTEILANQLLEKFDSKYNTILIYKEKNYIKMTFGYNKRIYTESVTNTKDRTELPVVYTRYMTAALPYAAKL